MPAHCTRVCTDLRLISRRSAPSCFYLTKSPELCIWISNLCSAREIGEWRNGEAPEVELCMGQQARILGEATSDFVWCQPTFQCTVGPNQIFAGPDLLEFWVRSYHCCKSHVSYDYRSFFFALWSASPVRKLRQATSRPSWLTDGFIKCHDRRASKNSCDDFAEKSEK